MQTKPTSIYFYGSTLVTFKQNDIAYVAMKPIAETIRLDWEAQRRLIQRDPVLSKGTVIMEVPSGRGVQKTLCMPIEYLNGWLFKINANRYTGETREILIKYQEECYKVLFEHWNRPTRVQYYSSGDPLLKPCPFCGKTEGQFQIYIEQNRELQIACACGARGAPDENLVNCLYHWNQRKVS